MAHVFLSPEWIDSAERIYQRHRHHVAGRYLPALVVNLLVTEAPFTGDEVEAHTDTTTVSLLIHRGPAPHPLAVELVDVFAAHGSELSEGCALCPIDSEPEEEEGGDRE